MLWLLREILKLKKSRVSLMTVDLLGEDTMSTDANLYSAIGRHYLLLPNQALN